MKFIAILITIMSALGCSKVQSETIKSAALMTLNCKVDLESFAAKYSEATTLPLAVDLQHSPEIEGVIILEGEPKAYVKALNKLNEVLNECEANSFTRFKLSGNVSQELSSELNKSDAFIRVENGYLYLYRVL